MLKVMTESEESIQNQILTYHSDKIKKIFKIEKRIDTSETSTIGSGQKLDPLKTIRIISEEKKSQSIKTKPLKYEKKVKPLKVEKKKKEVKSPIKEKPLNIYDENNLIIMNKKKIPNPMTKSIRDMCKI